MPPVGLYPFGRPILPRSGSTPTRRRVFVLGAQPSALHIAWWSPAKRLVQALPVDDEPAPFWDGADEAAQITRWKRAVGFQDGAWGEVATAGEHNGLEGRWLDEQVLAPLGVTRQEAWLTTCLDHYVAQGNAPLGIQERYAPFAEGVGLPAASVPPPLTGGRLATTAIETQRERLLRELSSTFPAVVVTLGHAPVRVLREIVAGNEAIPRLRMDDGYGAEQPMVLGKREVTRISLTNCHAGREPMEVHARWREGRRGRPLPR